MEQELASIIKLVLDSAGNPNPYYEHIPELFTVPAAYFPQPEVIGSGDTLCSYRLDFALYITFRAATQEDAFNMAFQTLVEIKMRNDKIPLIDETGNETGRFIRVTKLDAKSLDQCRAQLAIYWTSRRAYRKHEELQELDRIAEFINDNQ